ncbi:acyltransferase family-domain-containing protein [Xylariaceae sp. FL1651]|nr:acyltransferase family-domain-containing protein [Xylariaceae sp. FL1651]
MGKYANSRLSPIDEKFTLLVEDRSVSNSDTESDGSTNHSRSSSTHSNIRRDIEARFGQIQWAMTTKAYSKGLLRPSSWCSMLRRTVIFLLPSFTHHRFSPARERHRAGSTGSSLDTAAAAASMNSSSSSSSSSSNKRALSPTAYLDGMRGLAALFVFFCHYFYTSFVISEGYYKLPPAPAPPSSSEYTSLLRLPFVRLLYSGPSMVCVFFVISGYALSLRPLQLVHGRNRAAFARTLGSLVFRRFFRLYLPPVASTLGIALALRAGAYEGTRAFATDRRYVRNAVEHHPPRLGGPGLAAGGQLAHWAAAMWRFVHVWSWDRFGGSTDYDVHLWTIPVEFRCSMALFLVLAGTARLRPNVRVALVGFIAWFVLRSDHWEMLLFLAGMLVADLDVRRGAHEQREDRGRTTTTTKVVKGGAGLLLPLDEKRTAGETPPGPQSAGISLWALVSALALYLLSCPDAGTDNVPGWMFLGTLIPEWFVEKYRFWQIFGACLFVFCAARSRGWQRVFEVAPVQYLGRVSYAVYLCHGPVTHIAGFVVQRWMWGITGTEGRAYEIGAILAALINIPLVIWAADVFWRAVDVPTVRFAKWLEAKLSVEDEY